MYKIDNYLCFKLINMAKDTEKKQKITKILTKLDEIKNYFESQENLDLDKALKLYKKSVELNKKLEKLLKHYKVELEKIHNLVVDRQDKNETI